MIGVIDSKICNIFSLTNMLKKIGSDFVIIDRPEQFEKVDRIIIPGVGAYPKAMDNLRIYNLLEGIKNFAAAGKPILGICLGMQLLFSESEEFGNTPGLDLIPGRIVKIKTDKPLPHMGWNNLIIKRQSAILKGVRENSDVYFVHSYMAQTEDKYVSAYTDYGMDVPAVVFKDNIFGCQFHPEKSMQWGEIILKNFSSL